MLNADTALEGNKQKVNNKLALRPFFQDNPSQPGPEQSKTHNTIYTFFAVKDYFQQSNDLVHIFNKLLPHFY